MNIWIVTTGSSDVQLKSDEYWHDWYDRSSVKSNCDNLPFKPTQILEDSDEPYRIAPRVLGKVYESQREEVWPYLEFPLLGQFTTQLHGNKISKIYLLMTNQTNKFNEQREDRRCPYWQDTCELQPIFKRYFEEQEEFHDVELIPIYLSPKINKPGLDDWDHVLEIVRTAFREEITLEPDTVYVSHQAGTPAISSAVQFMSLARFGERVKFLVSNEYEKKPLPPIESSEYLKGIKFEQAKALLNNHDYSGVKELLDSYLTHEIKDLLDAAIQWNFAKFEDFAKGMTEAAENHSQHNEWWKKIDNLVKTRSKEWWWTAYESAYLGVVRLKQGNTVEAMFHSFRAVEGLLRKWADETYPPQAGQDPKQIQLNHNGNLKKFNRYGKGLYNCLDKHCHNIDPINNKDIWKFGNVTFDKRNNLFHQLLGMQDVQIFEYWDTQNQTDWEARVLGCLNFISRESFIPPLEEASLMYQVHKEVEKAIARHNSLTQ